MTKARGAMRIDQRISGAKSGLFLLISTLFFMGLMVQSSIAAPPSTLFLPLNVKTATDVAELEKRADTGLQTALESKDLFLLQRVEAVQLADYTGIWPPPPAQLQKIAEATDSDNIAAGNLTIIGEQISVDIKLFDLLSPTTPTYYFETAESLEDLERVLDKLATDVQNYTDREFRVGSIAPDGNSRIDSGAILRKIKTKSGDLYNPSQLRNDLKSIYKMGYFNDVQIDVTDGSKGKIIIFRVVEKPVIKSVIYSGIDELKEEDVKGAANIKEHFILNPAKITAAKEAIRLLYKTKGFYNSEVTSKISYPDDSGAIVEFKIDEGKKIYIKEITVEGNEAFDDDEILKQIETGKRWFLSWLTESGLLDMNKIKQDSQKIVAFYADNGYLDAKVGEPEISQKEEWLYIKFNVAEGNRYRVGNVDFSGDLLGTKEQLLAMLSIRDHEFVSRQVIRDDILKLTDYFSEAGYAFASIRPNPKKSDTGHRMDITYDIRKGNLVYIDRITIHGNSRTRDNVIRRELRVAEGGVFNSTALRESTQALQRLQFFEEVNITPEPSLDPDRMNIVIDIKEKSTGSFSVGAGYSSVDKLILMGQISENNFLGRGDTVSFSANVSGTSSRFNLAYTDPHLNDSALSWGMDVFSTEREYDDYTKDSKGGGIRLGYPIFGKWRVFGNYSYTDTDLSDVSPDASYVIRNSVDLHVTSAIKVSLVRDTRDRRFDASKGSRNVVSTKYAGGILGGDSQFTKVEGSTSWYFPLLFSTVFHVKGAAGQVFENETDKLPVYERFYLGGMNSIRGYEYGKISPIDPTTLERIGGDKMWYTNTEIIFPLLESQGLKGLAFYDAGQVLNDDEEFFDLNTDVKHAVGLGINWFSPMGPLRIVWGYNLDPLPDEDESVWDFSVGGNF
jgi:outer membrane protein insertion porin family